MSDHTLIEWVRQLAEMRQAIPATWNPIRGCQRKTDACRNCFAAAIAYRFKGPWHGLADLDPQGVPRFNGQVRFVDQVLSVPLKARKPRVNFVCDMSDLFGEGVPDAWIDRVFAVMALCPQHLFLLLTKRPDRMRAYLSALDWSRVVENCRGDDGVTVVPRHSIDALRGAFGLRPRFSYEVDCSALPLPNVWGGASIHDQPSARAFVPDVLDAPLVARFVSAEPLLGGVDLTRIDVGDGVYYPLVGRISVEGRGSAPVPRLDWVIVGGESGPKARPMHPAWARSLRDQCAAAGTPFFFKQWGAWAPASAFTDHIPSSRCFDWGDGDGIDVDAVWHVGKGAAGRLLDGRAWDQVPKALAAGGRP